jgi:alpha-glucosidase
MVENWSKQNIRVFTYLNPFFTDPINFTTPRINFYEQGLDKGYFVRDSNQSTYLMKSLSIEFATLDLSNLQARKWMKEIIINQTLLEAKSSGWMCDFGEYLPFDAVMNNGMTGADYHNYYPQAWAELTAEALLEYNQQYPTASNGDAVYFTRSAWIQSPSQVSIFWLGDQLMSYDAFDGMASVITGGEPRAHARVQLPRSRNLGL